MTLYLSQLIKHEDLVMLMNEYQTGLELIDFSISENLDNFSKTLENYHALALGSNPVAMHGPFFDLVPASYDSKIRQVTMMRFDEAYSAARIIGADHIVFHTGFMKNIYYYDSWLTQSVAFWQAYLKDKKGIPVYIENVEEDRFEAIFELLDRIASPDFNLCLDIGHAHARGIRDFKKLIRQVAPFLKHLHIHNNNGTQDTHDSLLKGTINYNEIFDALDQFHVKCNMTLELSTTADFEESLRYLRECRII